MTDPILLLCFAVPEETAFLRKVASEQILITGIGAINAKRTLRASLAQARPSVIITSGFAGGLNPKLPRGTIVWEAEDDFPLINILHNSSFYQGSFHCADRVAVSVDEKAQLWRDTQCDCVEMESGEIRVRAMEADIPVATVRVISDAADEDLPLNFNRFLTQDMRLSYLTLAGALLRQPGKVGALLSFRKRLREAAEHLADALLPLIQSKP